MIRRALLAATVIATLAACGGSSEKLDARKDSASPLAECIVGDWSATREAKATILKVNDQPNATVTGSANVSFSADGGIAYEFSDLNTDTLSNGSPGSKTIDGTVSGTFTLTGDQMTTDLTSSSITIELNGKTQTTTDVKSSTATVTCFGNVLTLNNADDGNPAEYRRM